MSTVVTGGAGLIGCHLVKRLVELGNEVVVLDDLSRGKIQNLVELGIALKPISIDLRNYPETLAALQGAKTVFHLAARVGSVEFLHENALAELAALQENLVIDANVFRACLEEGIERVVYASSVSVYPMDLQRSSGVILREEDLTHINPEGGYGWAKLLGEIQLNWMRGLNIGIARIFNVFGEGEALDKNAHVVPALCRKASLYPREEFRVWGDGNQTRDLLYVDNCVDALVKLAEHASYPPLIVNVGSGATVTIQELAEGIIRVSGKKIQPLFEPSKPVGPPSRTANVNRAKALLGWEPRISMEEGLERTFAWVSRRLQS